MAKDKYGLKFTSRASEDIDQILYYISEQLYAPGTADNLLDLIENSLILLQKYPYSGSLVLDEPLRIRGYRKLMIGNYLAFYLIDEQEKQVVIMRILYSARGYKDLL